MSDGATQQPSVNILSQLQPLSHSDNSVSTEASSVYNSVKTDTSMQCDNIL